MKLIDKWVLICLIKFDINIVEFFKIFMYINGLF